MVQGEMKGEEVRARIGIRRRERRKRHWFRQQEVGRKGGAETGV